MRKLIYQLPADSPDSIRTAAFPSPLEEKLNRIGLRFEDVSPIIHSFVDTIVLALWLGVKSSLTVQLRNHCDITAKEIGW